MNGLAHLAAGWVLARQFREPRTASRYRQDSCPALFLVLAGMLPDADSLVGLPHAQATHTALAALALATAFAAGVFALGRPWFRAWGLTFRRLLAVAFTGVTAHLVLDIFTFYGGPCEGAPAHVYFWPWWAQSFHLNCLFGSSPAVRAVQQVIEWGIATPLLVGWLVYRGLRYGENPLALLRPGHWRRLVEEASGQPLSGRGKTRFVLLSLLFVAGLLISLVGAVLDLAGWV